MLWLALLLPLAVAAPVNLVIKTAVTSVGLGRSVEVYVSVSAPGPVAVWPYVNETQWGSYVTCVEACVSILPLPHVGIARIQVAVLNSDPLPPAAGFMVGSTLPTSPLATSNRVEITVFPRAVSPPQGSNPSTLVGMEWEPWFTAHNSDFSLGEGVPLVGW
jgi:hypothetical protein